MAVNFSVQFRINEKTQSRVLRLTDTSTGFTLAKGNFSVTFPDGSTRIKTDFTSPDISTAGAFIDILLVSDISGAVLTGAYKIDFVALDGANTSYPLTRTFDFNWIKPVKNIVSGADVLVPEVKFFDNTSYSPTGNFTGIPARTFSTLMPSNTPQSGTNVIGIGNLINPIFSGNYYEGIYTVKSDISITYAHTTNSWLTVFYTELLQEIFEIKRAPTQTQLIVFMNTYHVAIEAYEDKNDTQFNLLNEQYDLVVALYSHIIARYESGTLDGSEPLLAQLLDILRPYSTHTYTSSPLTPFTLDLIGTTGFRISDGTTTDTFSLGEILTFASGSTALSPVVTNNAVTYTPTFGVTPNTFASGSDSRFHNPVTLGGSTNGLSLSTQQLSLALATTGAAGSMSSVDKAKLDSIASGAQTGTVSSVAVSMPSAFTVSGSPITTSGTIAITAAGLSTEFIRGDGATGNFNGVARAAISLTTAGTSGAATYNSTTGVLNVPAYQGGVTSFNTRTGAITLTSGDVTTALTFTPYNATNPSAFIALSALSAGAGISYNNTTGVIASTITQYTDALARLAILAGTGISYNSTTGVITNTITQYTDTLARLALTLTTSGTSGAATYNSTTGVLNIPSYQGGVTSFNTRTGAITLSSGDVTGALGFTPYNATNPAGYTTNVGTVTSVGGTGTVSGLTLTGSVSTSGNLTLGGALSLSSGNITSGLGFTPENAANKGVANGYASLDGGGLVPSTQLPSYVDDVLEFANLAGLPATGETGKIYVALDTNKIYRWSGATYIEVSPTVGTIWGSITGTLANQTDLYAALNAKQDTLTLTTTGTSGAATLVGATLNIPEYQGGVTSFNTRTGAITLTSSDVTTALTFTPYNATNPSAFIALTALSAGTGISYNNTTGVITNTITQYTDALARAAISLTTTGTSGAATYNSTTGVLNVPTYTLAGLGGITASFLSGASGIAYNSSTGVITYTGTVYTDASIRALVSAGAGLSYNSSTGVFSYSGTVYTDASIRALISLTTSGTSGVSTYNNTTGVLNVPNYTLAGLGGITLASLSGTAPITYNSSTGVIGITQASGSTNGFLSSTDWSTFNNKQNALTNPVTGTGTTNFLPKFTGASTLGNSNIQDSGTSVSIGGTDNVNINNFIGGTVNRTLPAGNTFAAQTFNINGSANGWSLINRNTWNFTDDAFTNGGVTMYDNRAFITRSTTASVGYINYQSLIVNNGTAAQSAVGLVSLSGGTGNFITFQAYRVGPNGPPNNTNSYTNYIGFEMNHTHNNVTNYRGIFIADFTGTALSRALDLNLSAGANKFNIYAGGTANNYMAGSLGIGATALTGTNLTLAKSITGAVSSYGVLQQGVVQSDVNIQSFGFYNIAQIATGTALPLYIHYATDASAFAGTATTQVGFRAGSSLTAATNNYGFQGTIAAGANRFNLYMNGTANNYLEGNLLLGTTVTTGYKLSVAGDININSGQSYRIGGTAFTVASTSASGFLTSTDWNTFNNKQNTITLTTTGTSGASTLISNTLNIPTYTLAGLGGVPTTRTITINGTTFDLSADRTYSITPSASARVEQNFTATASQTTFTITGGYVVGLVDVFINGARLLPTDYTATNGTTVVLGTGALLNDAVTVLNYTSTIAALPTSRDVFDYTATASQTTFTVSGGYTVGLLDVYVNGTKLTSSEVTATNGTTFVLAEASTVNNQVQAIRYNSSVNGVSGSGTANFVPKFTASGTIGNSSIFDNGSNVGIGTIVPEAKLDVRQATLFGDTQFNFTNSTVATAGGNLGATASIYLGFYNSSSALANVNKIVSGKSGDYASAANSNSFLAFHTTSANTTAEKVRITSAGNVGIGTSSPTDRLEVQDGFLATYHSVNLAEAGYGINFYTNGGGSKNTIAGIYPTQVGTTRSGSLLFFTANSGAPTERMRITSLGFTKMSNTGAYFNSTGRFHEFSSNDAGSNALIIRNTDTTSNPYGIEIQFSNSAPNNTTNHFIYMGDNSLGRAAIYSNGSYFSRTGVYGTVSDITLKENISPATPKLEDLLKINIVNYNFIGEEDKYIGVIAQQLEEIFPNMITIDGRTGKKGVKYSIFVPMLIKAIQELSAKITLLENK